MRDVTKSRPVGEQLLEQPRGHRDLAHARWRLCVGDANLTMREDQVWPVEIAYLGVPKARASERGDDRPPHQGCLARRVLEPPVAIDRRRPSHTQTASDLLPRPPLAVPRAAYLERQFLLALVPPEPVEVAPSLAAEQALGRAESVRPLRAMVRALARHYRFRGDHFDGYPLRWDVPTSTSWDERDGPRGREPFRSRQFFYEPDGAYAYAPPSRDPRWAPWRPEDHWRDLLPLRERGGAQFAHDELFDWYRRAEPSMDELCGLVAGYAAVARLATDRATRSEARRQASRLGDYLAEHAFMLVRPVGGFAARGSAGILPALEWPFGRALRAITGSALPARTGFQGACEKAGVWGCLAGPIGWWTAAGVTLAILASFGTVLVPAGLSLLVGAGTPLTTVQLARAYAVYVHRDCFDVSNDAMASEFAIAHLLLDLPSQSRFKIWLGAAAQVGGGYAGGFPPWIGLTAVDDDDSTVREAYLDWFRRRSGAAGDGTAASEAARSSFGAAVAALLGEGEAAERLVTERLEARFDELAGGTLNRADLSLEAREGEGVQELWEPAVDYLVGLALAWIHANRRARAGEPVSVPGFPAMPGDLVLPEPAVPADTLALAETGTITLPVAAIQGRSAPAISPEGARLFARAVSRPRVDPRAAVPPVPTALVYDEELLLRAGDGEVLTFAVVREGDDYEIEASGMIDNVGPEGLPDVTWDARFPLHSGIDPDNAHPDALVGRLNGYFFIGERRPRARWLYHQERMLSLRRNRAGRGWGGRGSLTVRVRVWGRSERLESVRLVSCIRRDRTDPDRRIDAVGGVHRDGQRWLAPLDEVFAEMDAGIRYFSMLSPSQGKEILRSRRRGRTFLRTAPGGRRSANLSAQTSCP
jgi:hypothetical protein